MNTRIRRCGRPAAPTNSASASDTVDQGEAANVEGCRIAPCLAWTSTALAMMRS